MENRTDVHGEKDFSRGEKNGNVTAIHGVQDTVNAV